MLRPNEYLFRNKKYINIIIKQKIVVEMKRKEKKEIWKINALEKNYTKNY